jgi:uncharacterized damage-inducible protein DinB
MVQLRDLLILEFNKEIGITSSIIGCFLDDHLKWKPIQQGWSLQERLSHLVNIPLWLPWAVEASELEKVSKKVANKIPVVDSVSQAQGLLRANAQVASDKLATLEDSTLGDIWTLRAGPIMHYSGTTYFLIKEFVINHMVHHRGQLSLCLRMLGLPLAPIYMSVADVEELIKTNQNDGAEGAKEV